MFNHPDKLQKRKPDPQGVGSGSSNGNGIRPPGQVGILHAEQRQRQRAVLLPRARREVFFIFGCWTKNRGILPPKWMVYNGKSYEQMDDLGGFPPIFGNTHFKEMSIWFIASCVWKLNMLNLPFFEEKQHNFWRCSLSLHPGKLTWQWKTSHLKMYLLFKMVIFHWHVSFLGVNSSAPNCV